MGEIRNFNNINKIKKPTWIVHQVFDVPEANGGIVYHTHGLNEYDVLELELNLPLEPKQATQFINLIGLEIVNGKKFNDGDFDQTIFSCKIAFKEVTGIQGNGEENLRIIFPDKNFKFPWEEGCNEPYKSQI
ncbi:MAG: hypothetical protein K0R54_542 [Clostridiaceae bacterium]|jgi:hypothetical protein|nr:hypothetical protein [Clostridiaceae bacterium]